MQQHPLGVGLIQEVPGQGQALFFLEGSHYAQPPIRCGDSLCFPRVQVTWKSLEGEIPLHLGIWPLIYNRVHSWVLILYLSYNLTLLYVCCSNHSSFDHRELLHLVPEPCGEPP